MKRTRLIGALAGLILLASTSVTPTVIAADQRFAPPQPAIQLVCPTNVPGLARCHAQVRTDIAAQPNVVGAPAGYGPSDLQSAYNVPLNGAGQLVAIVDAWDNPNAEQDLGVYRAKFGLPACTTANGCFHKVDQNGGSAYPPPDGGWAQEMSLDVDMVSAICPGCHILLVEASSTSFTDPGAAVNTAVNMGALAVSNSYGGGEFNFETAYDAAYYNHPGTAITASSGDSGYGVEYPAASQYVTAVGGTSLSRSSAGRGWTEAAWSGAGSGCSAYESKPSWQTDPFCGGRTVADVSAVSDPSTGVAAYDSFTFQGRRGWLVFGGTSVASPIVSTLYALAGNNAVNGGNLPYANPAGLWDVTSGSNGFCGTYLCTAEPGYDGPTGLGSPKGTTPFLAAGASPTPTPTLALSPTATPTQSVSPTSTPTSTRTSTPTPSPTTSQSATATFTPTVTFTPSATFTPTLSPTPSPTPQPGPDFSLAISPSSQSIRRGRSVSYLMSLSTSNGFGSAVALTVSGIPSGGRASITPASVTPTSQGATVVLAVSTSFFGPTGTFHLTVQATGSDPAATTHTGVVALTVT